MIRRILVSLLLGFVCVSLSACDQVKKFFDIKNPHEIARERLKNVETLPTVNIALVWPEDENGSLFIKGARLAVEEFNKEGGLQGKPITLLMRDQYEQNLSDKERGERGRQIARELSRNRDLFAVVGHPDSSAAVPASIVYEEYGVVFIAPGATSPLLTRHDFKLTFRTIQDDKELASRLARFADQQGWHRIGIVNERSIYGRGLTRAFVEEAGDPTIDISVVYRRSFSSKTQEYSTLVASLKGQKLDAILLVTNEDHGAAIVRQARTMRVNSEFIGGDGLYGPEFLKKGGAAVNGVFLATSIDPGSWGKESVQFADRFMARYNMMPNGWAAQGYDAVRLLGLAVKKTASLDRVVVTSALRYQPVWPGVASSFSFDTSGNVVNKDIFIKQIAEGKVIDVGTYTWNARKQEVEFIPVSTGDSMREG